MPARLLNPFRVRLLGFDLTRGGVPMARDLPRATLCNAFSVDPCQGSESDPSGEIVPDGTATAIVPRPLPPHLIDMIRSLYGVELIVKDEQTDSPVNGES